MLFLLNKLVWSLFVDHTKQKINKNSKGTLSLFAILYWMQAAAVITLKYTAVVSYTQYMQTPGLLCTATATEIPQQEDK